MSMDVSRLAIEVTTTGIKEASTALGGLSRTAGNTDKRVTSLTGNLANLMRASGNLTGSVSGLSGSMALINIALQSAATQATAMAQALAQSAQGMNLLTSASNQTSRALQEKSKWGGVVQTTLKAMTTAALAYVGVNFVKHSVQAADSWGLMQSKLKIATGSMDNAKVAQKDLFDMSQNLRVPMEAQIKLFNRMAPAMRNNKKSYEETKEVVEGVALALQLNGATAGEASSVMLQFSQSMQKGYLDGAEFNAVAENGSLLMQALSRHFTKGTGELKKMGSQSKITREEIQQAIAENIGQWRKDFASLPVTVDGAMQRIKNAWIKAMGELSADAGTNAGLVKTLGIIEAMIPVVRDELVKAFVAVGGWIDRNRDGISAVWDQTKGLLGDVWNIVTGVISLGGAISDSTDGVNVFAFAIFMIRAALAATVDIVKLVASSFVLAGADVVDFFVAPMWLAVKAVGKIAEGIGWTMDMLAKGASALGMDDVAKTLTGASGSMKTFVDGTKDAAANLEGITTGAREIATSWTSGQSELDKLLNTTKDVNLEVQKTAKWNKEAWNKPTGPADKKPVDKDAEKAHNKAMKEANSEMEHSLNLYMRLAETYELIQKYGLDHDKLTEAEKELIKVDRQLLLVKDAQARKTLEQARANALAAIELENINKLSIDKLKMDDDEAKHQGAAIAAAEKESRTLQDKINNYGLAKGAVEELALAQAKANLQAMIEGGETDASIERQRRLVAALEDVRAKTEQLGQLELGEKITKELDALKGADFGSDFSNSFGKIGKAIDAAGKSLDQYNKKMTC
jgi:tape measure domain-containing protein